MKKKKRLLANRPDILNPSQQIFDDSGGFSKGKYIIVRTLKNDRGDLAEFFTERSEVEKPKC